MKMPLNYSLFSVKKALNELEAFAIGNRMCKAIQEGWMSESKRILPNTPPSLMSLATRASLQDLQHNFIIIKSNWPVHQIFIKSLFENINEDIYLSLGEYWIKPCDKLLKSVQPILFSTQMAIERFFYMKNTMQNFSLKRMMPKIIRKVFELRMWLENHFADIKVFSGQGHSAMDIFDTLDALATIPRFEDKYMYLFLIDFTGSVVYMHLINTCVAQIMQRSQHIIRHSNITPRKRAIEMTKSPSTLFFDNSLYDFKYKF